jgi:hypothetical protein
MVCPLFCYRATTPFDGGRRALASIAKSLCGTAIGIVNKKRIINNEFILIARGWGDFSCKCSNIGRETAQPRRDLC